MRGKDMFTDLAIEELRGQIEHFVRAGRSCRSIRPSSCALRRAGRYRREDGFRFFQLHTDLIKRGKVRTPVEFGANRSPKARRA